MVNKYTQIQELLHRRADLHARLNLLPYDASPEVKEVSGKRYLYIRKRVGGRLTSTYVDVFSEELYTALLRYAKEARELKKQIRHVEKELTSLGYVEGEISTEVLRNLEFARINMKSNIYDQAILEGVATTFPQTEDIIDNGRVNGMTATDVQKILNLKHAWEFILDKDVACSPSDYYVLCHIASLVNEGFYAEGGRIRRVPVNIGGTTYQPPLPLEPDVKDSIKEIVGANGDPCDVAIQLCLYCMKTQIFNDGNKRTAVIFANHYLIGKGGGMLVIPEADVPEFKRLLVRYYEGKDSEEIVEFMRRKCHRKM